MTFDSLFSVPPTRRWGAGLVAGLLAVALVFAGCDSDDSGMDDPEPAPTTLTDVATDTDDLSTLATALGAADRADALDDTSATFTVFAPSNSAFGFYDVDFLTANTDLLGSVLDYHVVEGAAVTSDQLSDGDTFTTLQGDEIEVTIDGDGNVFVEGAQVTNPDVEADNGVAHVVDDVLLTNRTAAERLQVTNATETLFQAVDDAGLTSAFGNPDNVWTTFAPDNQAFENTDLSLFSDSEIQEILQYHTLDGTTDSEALLQSLSENNGEVSLPTNQGEEVMIAEQEDGSIVFNGGEAALNLDRVDQRASNGIIHPIDGVLTPPSIQATLADLVANTEDLSTLAAALGATGQDQALDNPDETYTVFAPANPAFGPYDVDFLLNNTQLLSDVLGYHVVQGDAVTSDQLSDGDTFTTLQGDEIEVSIDGDGNVFVEGAPVTTPDVEVDNGVAHVVGDVLLTNRSPLERLQVNTATQTLRQQLEDAGLASDFDSNVWTTFAPSNQAFENADLSGFSESEIQEILQYHTLDGATDSEALLQSLSENNGEVSLPTNQGEEVTITQVEPDSIVFNNGEAALNLDRVDQRAGNGSIIHQIDGLLIPPSLTRSVSYDLEAQMNDGAISGGVSGTVTFWEVSESETAVTLELDEGATGADVAHPAHIHANSASEGGGIEIYLTPIDGSGGGGTSARLVERPFDELATFDGYVNIHESVANLGTIVSQGNIGANAPGTLAAGVDLVDSPRSETYSLDANSNEGDVAPNGIPGSVTFRELTSGMTFVQVSLEPGTDDGSTGATVSHPAHIHSSADGSIEYYLSPVDGSDTQARSGKLVEEPYDILNNFDGYVNVHESVANLGDVVSQGNIGVAN